METLKLSGSILIGSVAAAVILGCGGGGGGGGGETPSTIDAAGIQEVAARFVANGMCTDVGGGLTGSSSSTASESTSSSGNEESSSTSSEVVSSSTGSSSSYNPFPATARYEYDYSYPGTLGGMIYIHYKHENGVTTYSYTMDDFENDINSKDITLNGKAETVEHGTPGDYGPITTNTTAQTNGPVSAEVSDLDGTRAAGETLHYDFELKGYNRVYATTYGNPDKITVNSVSMTDTDKNKKYSATNAKMDGYLGSSSVTIKGLTATYNDADRGTIKVTQESDSITVSTMTSVLGLPLPTSVTGSVEIEGTDGTKGSLEVDGSSVKIYTKDAGGNKTLVSDLDCQILTSDQ